MSGTGSESPNAVAFRQGLRDLGYTEGKNILVEYRAVEGKLDRASSLVAELVRLKVDLVVVNFLVGIRAAKDATNTTPIVMVSYADPVETGIIDSLGAPWWKLEIVLTSSGVSLAYTVAFTARFVTFCLALRSHFINLGI